MKKCSINKYLQIDAVKVSPSFSHPAPDANHGFIPITPYYKQEFIQYNLQNMRNTTPTPKSN